MREFALTPEDTRALVGPALTYHTDGSVTATCSCGWARTTRPFKAFDTAAAVTEIWTVHRERECEDDDQEVTG